MRRVTLINAKGNCKVRGNHLTLFVLPVSLKMLNSKHYIHFYVNLNVIHNRTFGYFKLNDCMT